MTDRQTDRQTDRFSTCRLDPFCKKGSSENFNGGGNTHTSKNSLREPQHSVSAPAHSFVIEPIPATSPQNGASSPVVLVEKSFGSIHTKNKELEIEIIEAQKDSNRVANDKKCPSQ